jgi:hypothetical protein
MGERAGRREVGDGSDGRALPIGECVRDRREIGPTGETWAKLCHVCDWVAVKKEKEGRGPVLLQLGLKENERGGSPAGPK